MIRILCFGKIKKDYVNVGINDYLKRLQKYHKIEIIELKDNDDSKSEEKEILKYINKSDYNVAMAIEGKQISSPDLADIIDTTFNHYPVITFVIGSSNGIPDNVKNMCNIKISFGNVTYPHEIFRLLLLEQIYRSFKINNKEQYHK